MADDAILIRDPQAVRAIQKLAQQTGRSADDLAAEAIQEKAQRETLPTEAEIAERRRRVAEALAAWDALPHDGEPLTDADLYDEDGLPR